jgi:hypothetical protein
MALPAYLPDAPGPVNLVLDLCIRHERFGSSSKPSFNGTLHYPAPADIDTPQMSLLLTRYVITVLIVISVTLARSLSCLPLLAPLAAFTVSLCAFCFGRLIGKPSASLQLQELRMRNTSRTSCASAALCCSSVAALLQLCCSSVARKLSASAALLSLPAQI